MKIDLDKYEDSLINGLVNDEIVKRDTAKSVLDYVKKYFRDFLHCPVCEKVLNREAFYNNKNSPTGKQGMCKFCYKRGYRGGDKK